MRDSRSITCARQRAVRFIVFALAVLMASCGGGGSEDDLHVDFRYGILTLNALVPVDYVPFIDGLQGKTPNCALNGTVPTGMAFQSHGCRLHGTPTASGEWGGTMVLTVDGYKGSLSSSAGFYVNGPRVVARTGTHLTARWREPFVITPAFTLNNNYSATPADQVTYALMGALPDGVTFDPSTNTLSGTTTASPSFNVLMSATIVRNGLTYTSPTATIRVVILSDEFQYPDCCTMRWAVPMRAAFPSPISTPVRVTYALSEGSQLPPGITLNSSTGEISGTPGFFDPGDPSYNRIGVTRTLHGENGLDDVRTFTIDPDLWPNPTYSVNVGPNLRADQVLSSRIIRYYGMEGDVWSNVSLVSYDPVNDPVPSWIWVVGTTDGYLYTNPPSNAVGTYRNYGLRGTVTRNGQTLTIEVRFDITVVIGT